jgi:hypothetical protein
MNLSVTKREALWIIVLLAAKASVFGQEYRNETYHSGITSGLSQPIAVYNNWSSYDELSDNIPLTEELAMSELNEAYRLKSKGVRIDYYVMDAFWFDRDGGYRVWNKINWPVNPSQSVQKIKFPENSGDGVVIYHDNGFEPVIKNVAISAGAEQLIVVGFGKYALDNIQWESDSDIKIPEAIHPLEISVTTIGRNSLVAEVNPEKKQEYTGTFFTVR